MHPDHRRKGIAHRLEMAIVEAAAPSLGLASHHR
ncbi:hypothetical protein M8494_21525 [Serratia ureilytica]